MSVLAQGPLRCTFLRTTHLPTPYWTPVKEGRRRRGSQTMVLRTVAEAPRAPPGSPPPTTRWDCSSRSSNTSHPSPSHRRQRRRTSRCWPSRDSRSLWCHVTFINTNQRGGTMATPRCRGWTTSCRTINLFFYTCAVGRAATLIDVLHGAGDGSSCKQTLNEMRTSFTWRPTPKMAENVSRQTSAQPDPFSNLISVQNLNRVILSSSRTWFLLHSSVSNIVLTMNPVNVTANWWHLGL